MNEQLKPHELATQLNQAEYEIVNGRIESEQLGSLIQRLDRVGAYGKFDENEYGHATVAGLYRGNLRDNDAYIVGASVTFHDPLGNKTELGGLHYTDDERTRATAIVRVPDGSETPLLPDDPRWDVVVGTISRAVDQSWKARFGKREQ